MNAALSIEENGYGSTPDPKAIDAVSRVVKPIDPGEMTVLIVDDMPSMCKAIRSMLKILGYGNEYHIANNGREAWNLLKKESIDLAIVDWNMPVMTGVELLSRIREDPFLRDMPVVMVTAEANREIVAEAGESEIDAYILKPLTTAALAARVMKVIEKANAPPPMTHHLKRARDFEDQGDVDRAIEEARLAMAADESSSRPLRELGSLHLKKNDLREAEKWLLEAVGKNELDAFAFHHLGELYLKKDDIDRASEYFEKAMQISPRHVSRGIRFGKLLVQKNRPQKAVRVFDKAIHLSDESLSVSEEIADFCFQNGIYDYPIDLYEFILRSSPHRYDIMFKLGVAYEGTGQYQKAVKYLEEVDRNRGEDIEQKLHLAKVYLKIDQVIRADRVLRSVLKIDPENQAAFDLLRMAA